MRVTGIYFRAHDPKWAWAPDSGDGAAKHGGRFNPVGTKALYLAGSIRGMFAEMGHGLDDFLEPMTICSYEVDIEDIVDLSSSVSRQSAGAPISALGCAWEDDLLNGRTPASWTIARKFLAQRAAGILVPSFAGRAQEDMLNLVLWRWGPALPHKVSVRDPGERLPRDQSAWQ